MADEDPKNSDEPTPTTPDPPAGDQGADDPPPFTKDADGNWVDADGNRVYSKQEFDSGMAAARKDGEKRAQRSAPRAKPEPTPKPKPKPKAKAQPTPAPDPDGEPSNDVQAEFERMRAEFDELKQQREFERRAIERGITSSDDLDFAFSAYMRMQPEDMGAFLDWAVERFGKSKPNHQEPAAPPEPPKPTQPPAARKPPEQEADVSHEPPKDPPKADRPPANPPKSPPTTNGNPQKADPLAEGGLMDVFALSEEDIQRIGTERVVAEFEKAANAHRVSQGAPPKPRALRQSRK